MKKLYTLAIALFVVAAVNAQRFSVDVAKINAAYTADFNGELVIDVAKAASKIAAPNLSFENPFIGVSFTEFEIAFDVYNYGDLKVLGALVSVFDPALGRMYFTNGGYLGFNAPEVGWFDANLIDYGIGTDFLGRDVWKNVKLQFTNTGFALYVDNVLAYNQGSADVRITVGPPEAPFSEYSKVLSFFQTAAIMVVGTGSWWSDNQMDTGEYWDPQFSYMKNLTFTPDFSTFVSKNELADSKNARLVSKEFFNISGAKVGSEYNTLRPGIYIVRSLFDNGAVKSTKIVKSK